MDFLDPKKKRNRKIRLAIGHSLMVLLVAVSTFILVYRAYGFDVDRKTGEVIQNGLVFVDSAPDKATIKINGKEHPDKTNIRFTLPEGNYTVELAKNGYRGWQRSFELDGGDVLRYSYPVLIPNELKTNELQVLDPLVNFASQSPDRRWIILGQKNNLSSMILYDLETRQQVQGTDEQRPTSKAINFSADLLTRAPGDHVIKLVEWSTDNKHLLLRHEWAGGFEFVMLNREEPEQSFNVNKLFNANPPDVILRDKNFEKLFFFDPPARTLKVADVKTRQSNDYATGVISYKPHGDDTVLMSVIDEKDPAKARIVMKQKDKTYNLRDLPIAASIPLEIARYDDAWYVAFSVQSEQRTYVYKNPVDLIGNKPDLKNAAAIVLRSPGPIDEVTFSKNTRFIAARSGQHFSVYDAEVKKRFSYQISQVFDPGSKPTWMDGHRILASSGGKIIMFDYDGINLQTLVSADVNNPVMFDRDYTELYSLGGSTSQAGKYGLFTTDLRLKEDK